jgi:hypothetical protein
MTEHDQADQVQDPAEPYKTENHVDTTTQSDPGAVEQSDPAVDKVLRRKTHDGPGDEDPPESDFDSFAAGENVLHDDDKDDS